MDLSEMLAMEEAYYEKPKKDKKSKNKRPSRRI